MYKTYVFSAVNCEVFKEQLMSNQKYFQKFKIVLSLNEKNLHSSSRFFADR